LPKGFVQLLVAIDVISALVLSASEGKGNKEKIETHINYTAFNEIPTSICQNNISRGLHSD
jgi:methionine synthase II (cobalamin-independent)